MPRIRADRATRRTQVIESTLHNLTRALREGIFAEERSRRAGFMQSLDPRAKILMVLELLVCVNLVQAPWILLAIYALILVSGWRSAVPPGLLIRRVWLAMPFFTLPLAAPALFLTPGPALLELPFSLVVTETGAMTTSYLLLRVSTSLSLTLLLIYTTSWNKVLSALTGLGVPHGFALVLGMTHRYVFLLLKVADDMFTSRRSRIVGKLSTAEGQRILGAITGNLLDKSLKLSSDVFLAMQSRGFRTAQPSLSRFEMNSVSWAVLVAMTVAAGGFLWLGVVAR